jgi:hypothetical protein
MDIFEFHEVEGMSFKQAKDKFFREGCKAIGFPCNETNSFRGEASAMLHELMGDDVDGIASMLDDAEYMGMFD